MKEKSLILLILTLLAVVGMASASWAASYYVDSVTGSDTNTGTQTAPWKTVAKVNSFALSAGDFVYFNSGRTWNEALYPKSGLSGKLITYSAYGSGNKPVIKNFYSDNKSYIKLQNLEFRSTAADIPVLIYNGSHHISIYNCNIIADTSCTAYVALWLTTNVSYNEIVGCDVRHNNINITTDTINLRLNANYNVIRDNNINGGTHYALTLEGSLTAGYVCNFNVIKNNHIQSKASGISIAQDSDRNVIEDNTVVGGSNYGFSNGAVRSFKTVSRNNIIRRNIIRDNKDAASSGISTEVYTSSGYQPNVATGNHIYNNIITNTAAYPLVFASNGSAGASAFNNYYKNNIVYNNGFTYQLWIMNSTAIYDNYFNNNVFYKSGVSNIMNIRGTYTGVSGIQSSDSAHFWGNVQQDPMLDANFQPQANSPCIDAGDFLTKVSSATGSGTTFTVSDAGYFSNGFGVILGDQIKVGNLTTRILAIDYAKNIITVEDFISWNNGTPVSLQYSGSKPDIGAFEYAPIVKLSAPSNLNVF